MNKIVLEKIQASAKLPTVSPQNKALVRSTLLDGGRWSKYQPTGFLLCLLTFVGCFLLTLTPLIRLPDTDLQFTLPLGSLLGRASNWMPLTLGTLSQMSSDLVEWFCLIALAFLCYILSAWLIGRQRKESNSRAVRGYIWLGTLLVGGLCLITPKMFSHDMLSYAGYSRLMATYHANPYFVTISAFPGDPLTSVNQWPQTISVYGPVWMAICNVLGWLLRPDPAAYVVAFRLVALVAHLLNTWLVGRTLQSMGRSPRTVTLGMLLYAWNPLVLIESCLNGHNDVLMVTFLLFGILLAVRAEKRDYLLLVRGFLPPMVAFTLAALVKFTCLPILAAYLLFLVCKALQPTTANPLTLSQAFRRWPRAAIVLCWACGAGLILALVLYSPFWIGHDLHAIMGSFTNNTASSWAVNSFERSIIKWGNLHPAQKHNHLWSFLSRRQVWNDLTFLAIALCLILGATRLWVQPTMSTFLILALAMMSLVLLLTPWFYPWYLIWIVSIAAVCIPKRQERMSTALCALTLTYSLSALANYLISRGLLGSHDYLDSLFYTLPPICAFLLCWIMSPWQRKT